MTDREKLAPYLEPLKQAYSESGLQALDGFDLACFAAQGFKETDWTWSKFYSPKGDPAGKGDGGHGHGIFQIDDRTYGDWIRMGTWGVPLENMRKALGILRGDRLYLKSLYAMPGVSADTFLRCVLAAYNCGPSNARKGLLHGDPDEHTATRDYSSWILKKAADLRVQMPELAVCV